MAASILYGVATYFYYEKVRRTMRTAIASNLLNIDESISALLIKNGSILRINHMYGFWSSSYLSQPELFKFLVFGKLF